MSNVKPFIKWVGGKGQLLTQLCDLLPSDFGKIEDITYVEPFIGGGGMLFHLLQHYKNIKHAVINDINSNLINCYICIRDTPQELIEILSEIQMLYYSLPTEEKRKEYFLQMRDSYNYNKLSTVETSATFIFLNKTCFNGLYRVNKNGFFNVPFGKYNRPLICNQDTIIANSHLLQRVEILSGDFTQTSPYISEKSFFYFDPPYRPLSNTSNFNDYTKETFDDKEQTRLKEYCDCLHKANAKFMLSNSDGKNQDKSDNFLYELYKQYDIRHVKASRAINSNANKRGKISELVIRNYTSSPTNLFSQISDPYGVYK